MSREQRSCWRGFLVLGFLMFFSGMLFTLITLDQRQIHEALYLLKRYNEALLSQRMPDGG